MPTGVFPNLCVTPVINSDQSVGKMPLTFLVTSGRSKTHGTNSESHQHISPKVTTEMVNEHTYLRPN